MSTLFFQGNKSAVFYATGSKPPLVFEGRCLWIDDADLIARLQHAGYEEILEADPRHALAVKHGGLWDHVLKANGYPVN